MSLPPAWSTTAWPAYGNPAVHRTLGCAVSWMLFCALIVVSAAADTSTTSEESAQTETESVVETVLVADTAESERDSQPTVVPAVDEALSVDSIDTLLESILTAGEQQGGFAQDTAASTLARTRWQTILQEIENLPPVRFVRVHALLLVLLAAGAVLIWLSLTYLTGEHEKQRFLTTTRLSIMDKEVQKACRYIERNYADPSLTPETLCRTLITSESFLSALFERELGMSVGDFIAQVRVNRVKILLRTDPHTPLSELAEKTGFQSADELCSAFAGVGGIAFEEYRDAVAANEEPEPPLA
ncbi:MAG: helix-turn-helix domain-containing protein [Chitinivibrionales bacterium]|nr:helix-turn-helix domain-containing protein [Chitinivibrionales bacterium]